ncbi:MAG: hypothetical protein Q9223_004942 [Gallowayella weberi]
MTRRVLQQPTAPEASNKSSTTASPTVVTGWSSYHPASAFLLASLVLILMIVTLILRQKSCNHAPSTKDQEQDAVKEPTSRNEMIPLVGIDRTSPGLRHQGPVPREGQTDCKQDSTKAFTDFVPPTPSAMGSDAQRALAKPPAGMKRWDSVERINGRRRHTVVIEMKIAARWGIFLVTQGNQPFKKPATPPSAAVALPSLRPALPEL